LAQPIFHARKSPPRTARISERVSKRDRRQIIHDLSIASIKRDNENSIFDPVASLIAARRYSPGPSEARRRKHRDTDYRYLFMDCAKRQRPSDRSRDARGTVDINLGAGGRNIRKQAGKNLYTTAGGAGSFVLSARDFSRYSRGPCSAFSLSLSLSSILFYRHKRAFIHEWQRRGRNARFFRERFLARSKKLTHIRMTESPRYANRCLNVNLNIS